MSNLYVDICPNCHKKSTYRPNPVYIHVCTVCGFKCSQSDLIKALNVDLAVELLKDLKEEIKDIEKNMNKMNLYYKNSNEVIFQ